MTEKYYDLLIDFTIAGLMHECDKKITKEYLENVLTSGKTMELAQKITKSFLESSPAPIENAEVENIDEKKLSTSIG